MFPLPDQDDQGAGPHAVRLLDPLPGQHHSQRGKSGHGPRVPRIGGSVRAHYQRFGTGDPHTPDGRGDHRHTRQSGADREILLPLARRYDRVAGYGTESRRVPRGQQARLPAHALRHGRPAGAREYGEPLRTSLDRPFGLPALVRGTGGPAARVRPYLQPVALSGRQRREPAPLREERPQHALARTLLALEPDQQGVDRPISERGALVRADLDPGALRRHGVERRRGGAAPHPQRRGQPARQDGVPPPPQHRGRRDALLGGHAGQRRGFPRRGVVLHLYRAGPVLLYGRDELPLVEQPLRDQDVRPHKRQAAASGHLGRADAPGLDHQPQQIRTGAFGVGQIVLYEPPRAPILRTGNAYRTRGYGQFVSRFVRADTQQDQGRRRDLLHLHRRASDQLQPFLHGRLRVRDGKAGQHSHAAFDPVEERRRESVENRADGDRQRRIRLHRPHQGRPFDTSISRGSSAKSSKAARSRCGARSSTSATC